MSEAWDTSTQKSSMTVGGVFMETETQEQHQLPAPVLLWTGFKGCAAFLGLTTHTD